MDIIRGNINAQCLPSRALKVKRVARRALEITFSYTLKPEEDLGFPSNKKN